jgi:hypothetical protein
MVKTEAAWNSNATKVQTKQHFKPTTKYTQDTTAVTANK